MAVVCRKVICSAPSFGRVMVGSHYILDKSSSQFLPVSGVFRSKITTADLPEFPPFPNAHTHEELHDFSISHSTQFWGTLARTRLKWFRDFKIISNCNMAEGKIAWFLGGKINVSVNCVDQHKEKTPDKIAIIWEKDEPGENEFITYKELYELVNRAGNVLRSHGVKRGDKVCLYMPTCPLAVALMLACARIGAIHNVVFAGFSAEALAARIKDATVETVITCDQGLRGGKIVELKQTVDEAVKDCPSIRQVFVAKRTGNPVPMGKIDIPLDPELEKQVTECEPEIMDSEDYLFMLYTSGSTGKPKGIAHTQAGYLLYAAITHKDVFQYREGDIYACVADIGWITGHTYVIYGPLCNGATTVVFESIPTYPDPGRYWEMVERLRINQFYGAPTAIRLLLKYGDEWVKKYKRDSLRTLGTVGEPINHEAWEWYHKVVGNGTADVVDTWWQTETGGICISPRPSAPGAEILPGMAMRPMFGISPAIMCPDSGKELFGNDVHGALCIKHPWPGMARTIYGHHRRFLDTYYRPFAGYYFSGDGGYRDADGYYHITGRMDDVINVSGHRLGTAEIEDAMDGHVEVAETAVVGYPHDIKGEGIYAYVTLKENSMESEETVIAELRDIVKNQIGKFAVPEYIQIAPGLPKTRSGKIMRRILRKISANQPHELGDTSTLAEPEVVPALVKNHEVLQRIVEAKRKEEEKKFDSRPSVR